MVRGVQDRVDLNVNLRFANAPMKSNHQITALLLLCAVLFSGCATIAKNDQSNLTDQNLNPIDPYENINRKFYKITDTLDRHILEPVANVYIEYVPNPLRRSIGNFYDNAGYPNVILNTFLQGKVRRGFEDTMRFAVNSTIGVAGLFDMATPLGLTQHDEDFGQTLAVWGLNSGGYLFVPFHGRSSTRDILNIPVGMVTNALFYISSAAIFAPIGVLAVIDKRARFSEPMMIRDQAALDPYLFVREASLQRRKHLIYDGDPPPESYEDFSQDDPLEEISVQSKSLAENPAGDLAVQIGYGVCPRPTRQNASLLTTDFEYNPSMIGCCQTRTLRAINQVGTWEERAACEGINFK